MILFQTLQTKSKPVHMFKFALLLSIALLATVSASAQTAQFDIKFQKETVLVNGKSFCLVRNSTTLPISYSILKTDGTEELVSIKTVYIQLATGKREGYFQITFTETGQTIERELAPGFGRTFAQELIETETLTTVGIDVDNLRRFLSKNRSSLSEVIKAKVKH
jgi:hypothetical protein